METKPSQYDYVSLYEWHSATALTHDTHCVDAYSKALAARAAKLGTLQCAIRNKSSLENAGFLQAMVERMELGLDEMAALPLPRYVLQSQKSNHQNSQKVAVSMDDFFEEYPECIRPGWEHVGGVDSSDESTADKGDKEDEEEDPAKKSPVENPSPANVPDQPLFMAEGTPLSSYALYPSQISCQENRSHLPTHINVVRHNQPFIPVTAISHQHPTNSSFSAYNSHPDRQLQTYNNQAYQIYNQGWDGYPSIGNRGWEDDPKDQNAFQTARDYANSIGDNNLPRQQQPPTKDNGCSGGYNPHLNKSTQEEIAVAPEPPIRVSLKRKFQYPKKGSAPPQSSNKCNNTRKTTKPTGICANSANPSCGDEETDENDLPEELRKYGKDLVEKIQSEIMHTGEQVTFDDIAGLEDAKATIQEIVCWPMKRPELFTGLRKTPNGVLLFGPPGTGKTLIGKAIANTSGATFFSISSSALTSKWMGEGEKLVRTLFAVAAFHEPACIFVDEVDSLLTQRKSDDSEASRRIKTQFLVELDGSGTSCHGRVLVIGATNRPQELDEAARRRFVKRLYIPLPTGVDRVCLFNVLLRKNEHTLSEKDVEKLARETEGFSGADLKALCADAAMGPIRQLGPTALDIDVKDLPPITKQHFRQALRGMNPSVSPEDIKQYLDFNATYGSKRAPEVKEGEEEDDELSYTTRGDGDAPSS